MIIKKIISGGQTGADQAGLDAAIEYGLPYGGTIPLGRRTEIGPLSHKYVGMVEHSQQDYRLRTELNVLDSDGTLILTFEPRLSGGSGLTRKLCHEYSKPSFHVNLKNLHKNLFLDLANWFLTYDIRTLNVAGQRESRAVGIHDAAKVFLIALFGYLEFNPDSVERTASLGEQL